MHCVLTERQRMQRRSKENRFETMPQQEKETLLRKECLDTVGNERTQALVRSRLFFVDICLGIF